jgi:hypothetical protein
MVETMGKNAQQSMRNNGINKTTKSKNGQLK